MNDEPTHLDGEQLHNTRIVLAAASILAGIIASMPTPIFSEDDWKEGRRVAIEQARLLIEEAT